MRARTALGAIVLATAVATPGSAMAKGGGNFINPSCWWDPAVSTGCDATASRVAAGPKAGDQMTFDYGSRYMDSDNGTGPWLRLKCVRAGADYEYEGQLSGVTILVASRSAFPGGISTGVPFELASSSWTMGPADCVATVGHHTKSGKFQVDATTSFSVTG